MEEEDVIADDVETSDHGVEAFDSKAWKSKRLEWVVAMWTNIDNTRM